MTQWIRSASSTNANLNQVADLEINSIDTRLAKYIIYYYAGGSLSHTLSHTYGILTVLLIVHLNDYISLAYISPIWLHCHKQVY